MAAATNADAKTVIIPAPGNVLVSTFVGLPARAGGGSRFGSEDGIGSSAAFSYPAGLAFDSRGAYLYVCDFGNKKIRKVHPHTGEVTTFAGNSKPDLRDGVGTDSAFNCPASLVFDKYDNCYIADEWNHRIRRITPSGAVTTVPVDLTPVLTPTTETTKSFFGLSRETVSASVPKPVFFTRPTGIAVASAAADDDTGFLFVCCGVLHHIKVLHPTSGAFHTFAGSDAQLPGCRDGHATTEALFSSPGMIVYDSRLKQFYVSDVTKHVIKVIPVTFTPKTAGTGGAVFPVAGKVRTLAGPVTGSNSSDEYSDGVGTSARFSFPYGLALDLWPPPLPAAANSKPNATSTPRGPVLYVCERGGHRVRAIDVSTGLVSTVAGNGDIGRVDGLGATASFNRPSSVAIDSKNQLLYVGDHNHVIRKVHLNASSGAVNAWIAADAAARAAASVGPKEVKSATAAASVKTPESSLTGSGGSGSGVGGGSQTATKPATASAVVPNSPSAAGASVDGSGDGKRKSDVLSKVDIELATVSYQNWSADTVTAWLERSQLAPQLVAYIKSDSANAFDGAFLASGDVDDTLLLACNVTNLLHRKKLLRAIANLANSAAAAGGGVASPTAAAAAAAAGLVPLSIRTGTGSNPSSGTPSSAGSVISIAHALPLAANAAASASPTATAQAQKEFVPINVSRSTSATIPLIMPAAAAASSTASSVVSIPEHSPPVPAPQVPDSTATAAPVPLPPAASMIRTPPALSPVPVPITPAPLTFAAAAAASLSAEAGAAAAGGMLIDFSVLPNSASPHAGGADAKTALPHDYASPTAAALASQFSAPPSAASLRAASMFRRINYIDAKDITLGRQLGTGSYGVAYLANWKNSKVVCKKPHPNEYEKTKFLSEAALLEKLGRHDSIIRFIGACMDPPYLVLAYAENGTMEDVLIKKKLFNSGSNADLKRVIQMAVDVSAGLTYLHSENIVHRDLACRNLLVTSEWRSRVNDFGMSRALTPNTEEALTNSNVGPLRWMSPESLSAQSYSFRSDVWMFGIVLWEMFARTIPYRDLKSFEAAACVLKHGNTLVLPASTPEPIRQLFADCTALNPSHRPTAEQIYVRLSQYLDVLNSTPEMAAPMSAPPKNAAATGAGVSGVDVPVRAALTDASRDYLTAPNYESGLPAAAALAAAPAAHAAVEYIDAKQPAHTQSTS